MAEKEKAQKKKENKREPNSAVPIELGLFFLILFFIIYQYSSSVVGTAESIGSNVYVVRFIFSLKILSALVSVLSIAGIAWTIIQNNRLLKESYAQETVPHAISSSDEVSEGWVGLKEEWQALRSHLETASDADSPMLIIEADTLVDRALKGIDLPGVTMGERMKSLEDQHFAYIQDLWDAHKLRNQIAHEGAKDIHYSDALYAIEKYEKVLRELGVI